MQIILSEDISPEDFREGFHLLRSGQLGAVTVNAPFYQTLEESVMGKTVSNLASRWMSNIGIGGIGQYSLNHGPANFIARFDLHFRPPTEEEKQEDFREYGEQVLGPTVNDVKGTRLRDYLGCPLIRFLGEDHFFLGPMRIEKARFITDIFTGPLPQTADETTYALTRLSEASPLITFNGHHVGRAENGCLKYGVFREAEDFSKLEMKDYGCVTLEDERRKLMYYPPSGHPVDFTPMLKD